MLNEELSWTEVGALSTGSGSVRDAFQLAFGDPTKELLPAGMSLYKFNGFSTLGPGTIRGLIPFLGIFQAQLISSARDRFGENSRNGILCTLSVNRPRERRMSIRPRSAG